MKDVELWHGDCLDLLKRLPEKSVQLFLCDLPYARPDRGCTANSWDKPLDIKSLWTEIRMKAAETAACVFFCNQRLAVDLIAHESKLFKYDLIWSKDKFAGFLRARDEPLRAHETLLFFSFGRHVYNPQKVRNKRAGALVTPTLVHNKNYQTRLKQQIVVSGWGYPRSIVPFCRDVTFDGTGHPTQKPVSLLEWIIKTYTNPGDLVVDPTAGSMSTAVAAKKCRRRVVCIEKNDHWFHMGRRRVFSLPPDKDSA